MPSEVALIPIAAALTAVLEADATLTALLGVRPAGFGGGPAIFEEGRAVQNYFGPAVTPKPYLTIGAGTQVPQHSVGFGARFGWNCTVQIKAVGQGTEATVGAVLSRAVTVLYQGRPLTVAGYGSAYCSEVTVQPTLIVQLAGMTTLEIPAILRVLVHDA